ncbi:MAG: hypothetical protein ACRD17_09785 [Terriglobales bacterium]
MNAASPELAVPVSAVPAASRWAFAALPPAASPAQAELWPEDAAAAAFRAAAGCALVQVGPPLLAAAVAAFRATAVRVAARIGGPAALASTQLFDAQECLRLGAEEIAWPLPAAAPPDPALAAAIAAAAALCHDAGARLKLLAPRDSPALRVWARDCAADALAILAPPGAPAGAVAAVWDL